MIVVEKYIGRRGISFIKSILLGWADLKKRLVRIERAIVETAKEFDT